MTSQRDRCAPYPCSNLQVRKRLTSSDLEALRQFDRQGRTTGASAEAVRQLLMSVREADAAVATITCSNPLCSAVQTVAGPAFKRCSVCHAAVYCNKRCQTAHWRSHKLVCSPALATGSELSSNALHAITIAQRLLTLNMPSIRLQLTLKMRALVPEPGYVVYIGAMAQPSTVRVVDVPAMRTVLRCLERIRLGLGDVHKNAAALDRVCDEMVSGLGMGANAAEFEIGCIGDGRARGG